MIKINKKTRMVISGILVGLASIGAVASYFELNWAELLQALVITVAGFVAIVLLAALAVVLIKLPGMLIRRLQRPATQTRQNSAASSQPPDSGQASDKSAE